MEPTAAIQGIQECNSQTPIGPKTCLKNLGAETVKKGARRLPDTNTFAAYAISPKEPVFIQGIFQPIEFHESPSRL